MGPDLTWKNTLENHPKINVSIYISHASVYLVCLYVIKNVNVDSRYDLSVMSMSVMEFQKKLDKVVGGWYELNPVFWGFVFKYINIAKTLKQKWINK